MSAPGYVISVFQAAGMCSGSFDHSAVLSGLQTALQAEQLVIDSWEPVAQDGCFAVVLFARAQAGQRVDLLQARRRLTDHLAPRQLQLRIQREDVFLAMHRL